MKYSENKTLDKQYLEKYENIKSTVIPRAIIISRAEQQCNHDE